MPPSAASKASAPSPMAAAYRTLQELNLLDLYSTPRKRDTKEWLDDFAHAWRTLETVQLHKVVVPDSSYEGWALADGLPVHVRVLASWWPKRCYLLVQPVGLEVDCVNADMLLQPIKRTDVAQRLDDWKVTQLRLGYDLSGQRRCLPVEWLPRLSSTGPQTWVVVRHNQDPGQLTHAWEFRVSRGVSQLKKAMGLNHAEGVVGRLQTKYAAWGEEKWAPWTPAVRRVVRPLLSSQNPTWLPVRAHP